MQLVVEIMMGTIFHIQVGDNATVLDLKIAIHNQENVPGDRLILLVDRGDDHIIMNDDQKTLGEYGVKDGSRLQGIFKPLEEEKDDDDDTGDDMVMDKDRTESEAENERDDNSSDDDSGGSSTPKTPNEESTGESPEYMYTSD